MSINPEQEDQDAPVNFLDLDPQIEASDEESMSVIAPDEEIQAAIAEAEEDEEAEFATEEEPQPVADATPRAQKRIRQLAEQKNELAAKNEELLALVEQLKKSNELQTKMQERQEQFWAAQENQTKAQQRRQLMLQYGLNPEDTRDAIAFEQMEYKAQLEDQLRKVQEQLQQQQEAVQIERFNQALDQGLSKRLKEYAVPDDMLEDIREVAYDIAALRGVTAGEAAEAAIKRYQKVLPKRKRKAAAKVDEAAKLVARTGNRAKSKAPGQDAKGATDFMDLLDSGKFFL